MGGRLRVDDQLVIPAYGFYWLSDQQKPGAAQALTPQRGDAQPRSSSRSVASAGVGVSAEISA